MTNQPVLGGSSRKAKNHQHRVDAQALVDAQKRARARDVQTLREAALAQRISPVFKPRPRRKGQWAPWSPGIKEAAQAEQRRLLQGLAGVGRVRPTHGKRRVRGAK